MIKSPGFFETTAWKKIMNKAYAWGAAVVIIGVLMKLEHYAYSSYFLVIGLGTEALIFFLSGFEPIWKDYDWGRVYPELDTGNGNNQSDHFARVSPVSRFDQMLEKAEITPELFEKLGQGLKTLNDTTSRLSDISEASVATNDYVSTMKAATNSVNAFADSYHKSTEALNTSASELTHSYQRSSEVIAQTGEKLADQVSKSSNEVAATYQKLLESINKDFVRLSEGNTAYGNQLEQLNKNLSALNSIYEIQLAGTDKHVKTSEEVYSGLDNMLDNLKTSVEETSKYQHEVTKLGQKLEALNTVYGNMLTAMNVKGNI